MITLMKRKLVQKILIKFVGLWAKTYNYLIDDGDDDKTAKTTKLCHKKTTYV